MHSARHATAHSLLQNLKPSSAALEQVLMAQDSMILGLRGTFTKY
jgi:hypothetical protein|tara:strand:+ start:1521 stop:1655 length:135 start_codon:yes stop_codon:yes gene_type:complete